MKEKPSVVSALKFVGSFAIAFAGLAFTLYADMKSSQKIKAFIQQTVSQAYIPERNPSYWEDYFERHYSVARVQRTRDFIKSYGVSDAFLNYAYTRDDDGMLYGTFLFGGDTDGDSCIDRILRVNNSAFMPPYSVSTKKGDADYEKWYALLMQHEMR
ncbi:hypothetical protein C4573_04255 [Candidatus Woesearchaeota archaeon]|nr:MAG: hypothetical protein C4573_04255 [Candidatus Woesearchaeota archaeon]